MTFTSYHWPGWRFDSPALEQAREALVAARPRAAMLRGFEALLRSNDPGAIGIALDHFAAAGAATRHGVENEFEPYVAEVKRKARDILREPPLPAQGDVLEGANHASALTALLNLTEPSDAPAIANVLEQARTLNVRHAAAMAAMDALEHAPMPDARLLSALGELALNRLADRDERRAAISAVGRAQSSDATDILLRLTSDPDIRVQAQAGWWLLHRDRAAHRAYVESLARSWEPGTFHVDEVLEELDRSDGE